jgi:hypothetical protein
MKPQYWLVFLVVLRSSFLLASENSISGTVLDVETKEPLPYASIMIVGKQKGTVTNEEGSFMLDLEGISLTDTILFRYMGYETKKITISQLQQHPVVYLKPAALNLAEVKVVSKKMPPEEIIRMAYKNFEHNHPSGTGRRKIFIHKYGKIPFQKENKLILKETNFVGLDKKTFEELLQKMPKEFIDYQDAIIELYSLNGTHKLIPVKAISLEEGSQQTVIKEFETKLGSFFEDIDKSMGEKDIYYKIRTGIFSQKWGNKKEDKEEWNKESEKEVTDSLNYTIQVETVKNYLGGMLQNYARADSDNWEFLNSPGKYEYQIDEVTIFNEELVYKISFTPKKRGLFEGSIYISIDTYAILQLDFAFAKGKQSDTRNIFGYRHATNFKGGHLLFEKGDGGYFLKYLYAKQKEFTSLDRDFSVMKKQKRFLIDKELNEFKIETELFVNSESIWELLVLEREEISPAQFEKIKEPTVMKFKKEYAYTPEMWENRTVIVPSSELKKYKRK